MNGFLIITVLLLLSGIILLSGKSFNKKKTREQFLKELTEFLDGTLEPIEDETHKNSFRIRFKYSDEDFVYEDLEKSGFKKDVNMAYLKVETPDRFTLKFQEKKHTTTIRKEIFIASEISAQSEQKNYKLQVPKHLELFNVIASDPVMANKLFEDKKISSILKELRNTDTLGHPFLSIGIDKGIITLEFFQGEIYYPRLISLYADVSTIDHYLSNIMTIVRKLKTPFS